MQPTAHVLCPVCGDATVLVSLTIDPGEPMVMYYPDGSGHPGSPPGIEDHEVEGYDCDCRDNIEQNSPTALRRVLKKAATVVFENGKPRHVPPEYEKDENGHWKLVEYQPLLEAYDECVSLHAECLTLSDVDFPEPDHDDWRY